MIGIEMVVRINKNNHHLWCIGCKEKINLGEKFIVVSEEIYNNEIIDKEYHTDCVPAEPDEEDEVYISPDED